MASFSSVSLPQGQKSQSGFIPSCFSESLGALGMGLPSHPQLCPGEGPQPTQGQLLITVPQHPPPTAHIGTRHPKAIQEAGRTSFPRPYAVGVAPLLHQGDTCPRAQSYI